MLVDDKSVIMTRQEFDDLPDYSMSLPSGTTIGKRWKRSKEYTPNPSGWLMGEYTEGPADRPDLVGIRWRNIIEVV